jgi:hypothetical protein
MEQPARFRAIVGGYAVSTDRDAGAADLAPGSARYVVHRPDGFELGRDVTWVEAMELIRSDHSRLSPPVP